MIKAIIKHLRYYRDSACYKLSMLLLCLFAFTACDSSNNYQCIAGDDFGSPNTRFVSAKGYDVTNLDPNSQQRFLDTELPFCPSGNVAACNNDLIQMSSWKYTGLVISQNNISVKVSGGWVPWIWYGDAMTPEELIERAQECPFSSPTTEGCSSTGGLPGPLTGNCKITNGRGLYMLLVPRTFRGSDGNQYTPNATLQDKMAPNGVVIHLDYDASQEERKIIGYRCLLPSCANSTNPNDFAPVYKVSGYAFNGSLADINLPPQISSPDQLLGAKVYLKILDNHYHDNQGGYEVEFTGIQRKEGGIVTYVLNIVLDTLLGEEDPFTGERTGGIARKIYTELVGGSGSRGTVSIIQTVRLLLVLYIALYGFFFIFGMVEAKTSDFIIRCIKFALVVQLISPYSWQFFDRYLFSLFLVGMEEVIALVSNPLTSSYNTTYGKLDEMIDLFTARETHYRILSLIFNQVEGIFYAIGLYVVLFFFFFAVLVAVMALAVAYLAITLLIILGPIFISTLLFNFTRKLFDEWIKQFVNYVFQPVLLFAGIGLLTGIVMGQFYTVLGFQICYRPWFSLLIDLSDVPVPPIPYVEDMVSKLFSLFDGWFWLPFISDTYNLIAVPPDRQCMDWRYIDFPFLDPDNTPVAVQDASGADLSCQTQLTDTESELHKKRIEMIEPFSGSVTQANHKFLGIFRIAIKQDVIRFVDIIIFLFVVLLFWKFSMLISDIGRRLSKTAGGFNVASTGRSTADVIVDTTRKATNFAYSKVVSKESRDSITKAWQTVSHVPRDMVGSALDKATPSTHPIPEARVPILAEPRDAIGGQLDRLIELKNKAINKASFGLWGEDADGQQKAKPGETEAERKKRFDLQRQKDFQRREQQARQRQREQAQRLARLRAARTPRR